MTTQIRQQQIIQTVYEQFGADFENLSTRSRKRAYVMPRQVSMYFLRAEKQGKRHTFGLKNVGQIFGRDHSSVCYAQDVVQALMATDKSYKAKVDRIAEILNS